MNVVGTPEKNEETITPSTLSSQIDWVLDTLRSTKECIAQGKRNDYEIGDYYTAGFVRTALSAIDSCINSCELIYKAQLENEICVEMAKKFAPDKIVIIERGNN